MKMFLGKRVLMALGVVALSLGATTSTARAGFTLFDLENGTYTGSGVLPGGVTYAPAAGGFGILVGDKLFTNFTNLATGQMPGAASINVVGIVDGLGNLGIRFQGAFHDVNNPGGSDELITYHVHVTLPGVFITDAHILANLATAPLLAGGGQISVNETFLPGYPNAMFIFSNNGAGVSSATTVFVPPTTDLNVQKDILADANLGVGLATASFIDQTYSQTRFVPEPASFALVGVGLLGTGYAAYRRRKMAV